VVIAAACGALALSVCSGCGGSGGAGSGGTGDTGLGVSLQPTAGVTGGTGGDVPGSLGLFQINSHTYSVDQVGGLKTSGFVPGLDYDGPAGCAGRIFDVAGRTVVFRYTAHNALMQDGDTIFYFPSPPRVSGHTLAWSLRFVGPGENDRVSAAVYCPLPSKLIPPIPDAGQPESG
jgi:hypothetical protein